MVKAEGARCDTCPHWRLQGVLEDDEDEPREYGVCRFTVPGLVVVHDESSRLVTATAWPETFGDQDCGEHPNAKGEIEVLRALVRELEEALAAAESADVTVKRTPD